MLKHSLTALAFCYVGACFAALDVNTATDADLDSIKRISPAMSSKILDEHHKGLANQERGATGFYGCAVNEGS